MWLRCSLKWPFAPLRYHNTLLKASPTPKCPSRQQSPEMPQTPASLQYSMLSPVSCPMRRYVSILKLTHVGRVTSRGLVGETNDKTRHSDTNHNAKPISPEEVLFRKKAAPTRFEETDFYFAHEQLPASRRLPDSDLDRKSTRLNSSH